MRVRIPARKISLKGEAPSAPPCAFVLVGSPDPAPATKVLEHAAEWH